MRVLVIDDEPAVARAIRRMLADDDVAIATDATCALAHLHEVAVELVVCDFDLPDMNGLELHAALREPPMFILMSGHDEVALGAPRVDGILTKPFRSEDLHRTIAHARALRRLAS